MNIIIKYRLQFLQQELAWKYSSKMVSCYAAYDNIIYYANRSGSAVSIFKARTEDSSASQYFQFYGYLSQQQNMMQDFVRTSTYQKAILSNLTDFRDKVVLDVGAGSGILSFFAQQAGAAKVLDMFLYILMYLSWYRFVVCARIIFLIGQRS